MDKIPSLIPNVVFIGEMNAGKSSLINSITKQNVSIVSEVAGTTTDEVTKRFELLDVGPINLIDTAGLNDKSELGHLRYEKTDKALKHASLVVYVVDASIKNNDFTFYKNINKNKVLVFNKVDLLNNNELVELKKQYPHAMFICTLDNSSTVFINKLTKYLKIDEKLLLDDIHLLTNKIVHVIPIDSEAPKGRIILPQMQLIRECLDLGYISIVINENELSNYIATNDDVALIVTDSKIFGFVSKVNNKKFPLTSYSILQAHQKGDLDYFVESLNMMPKLKEDARILIMESCSHNVSHEDIGSVIIPEILRNSISDKLIIDFKMSKDFYNNLEQYDFIVHCGSCMLSRDIMQDRISFAKELKIPMTNYGLLFAYKNGILEEAINIY